MEKEGDHPTKATEIILQELHSEHMGIAKMKALA